MDQYWPVRLFNKSVLKQRKFREISGQLGETQSFHCLDIGSDNGVISYLLRQRGGTWKSADLEAEAIDSIRSLVQQDVFQIDGRQTPFDDNEFDRVVIVDFLEHIHTDREFVEELFRILKPGGELIINVPYTKQSVLRKLRLAIGQTDEKHGHVRPGYTTDEIHTLLGRRFSIITTCTYSKFFSECIDTLITGVFDVLKGGATSRKGRLVTGQDLQQYQKMFRMYSFIYPVVWLIATLDKLLFWCSGYMLLVRAKTCKEVRKSRLSAVACRNWEEV
jgi:SAM-dependent methyltransferase